MKILAFASDETACSWQRLYLPLHYMRAGGLAEVTFCWSANEALCSQADVVVYQRHYQPEPLAWWREMLSWRKTREKSPALVWEMDDDIWAIPDSNPFKKFYTKEVLASVDEMVATADLVTVTSIGLAAILQSKTAARVVVLPSGLDPEALTLARKPAEDGIVRIGYAASDTHRDDLDQCASALRRVLIKRPNARLVLKGIIAKGSFDDLPADQVIRVRWETFNSAYYSHLAELAIDIWIAPLKASRFNRAKAHVKLLEAFMLKSPIICSPVGIYAEVLKNGVTGLFASTPAGWEDALLRLIDNQAEREAMGGAGYECAKQYTYDRLAANWLAAYEEAVARKVDVESQWKSQG